MKLRFRANTLRLRVNQREVEDLAAGASIEERVSFPDDATIRYVLEPSAGSTPAASFREGTIRVSAPGDQMRDWARSDAVGIYFELPANGTCLKVAIEKDLECVDGPPEERDPEAFPRATGRNC
ncbi:MAG: hypothetical protein JOZ62_20800 [Acidobacteriaceae bacterium]|nr:hypothetical protein [Acidobacteriaceae bacterium]